ncbi:MAG: hypothetical protein H0T41_06195, partial [Rhodobacteraceae bacterium]|nr:hypothetical protein [Paracoccaceae bacterium]
MPESRRPPRRRDPVETVIGRTRAGMALERALRAFWPLAALAAVVWAALAFGVAEALPHNALLA